MSWTLREVALAASVLIPPTFGLVAGCFSSTGNRQTSSGNAAGDVGGHGATLKYQP
jgi:hypothetical protein